MINKQKTTAKISSMLSGESALDELMSFMIERTGYPYSVISGRTRKREVVFVRQLYCYIAITVLKRENYEGISLATIGHQINRDHATVMHSEKTINDLCETNKSVNNQVSDAVYKFKSRNRSKGCTMGVKLFMKNALKKWDLHEDNGTAIILRAYMKEKFIMESKERVYFNTGISVLIPKNYEGQITPIEKTAFDSGLTILNSPIIIPSGDKSEMGILLMNHGEKSILIKPGEPIGKLMFYKVEQAEIEIVDNEELL